jgi:hypothetical protein
MNRSKLYYGVVISQRHSMLNFMEVPWVRWNIAAREDAKDESAVMGEDSKNKRRNIKRFKQFGLRTKYKLERDKFTI